nr:MAG TPA: hypothetical protein [Caudoviricetes sp.]
MLSHRCLALSSVKVHEILSLCYSLYYILEIKII